MARQSANRPTNTDISPYLLDFTGVDFNENKTPQEAPQEEPGFLSKLANSGSAIFEGIAMIPGGIADTVRDAWSGGDIDVTDKAELERRAQRQREKEEYARKYQGKTFEGIPDAMTSLPYSLATMGASLGAGTAAGIAGGPVAAGAAGMAASGTVAYRATKEDFMRRMLGETEKALGRMPTQEEWDRVAAEFDSEATKFGLWEAGPEALSNLFMAKLLGPLGSKVFKGGVGQAAKRVAGLYGEEFATETATQMGQGSIEAEVGLRDQAPGAWEAFKEIAPATFWQTTLMAGGKKAADIVASRMRRRSEDAANNAVNPDGQTPQGQGGDIPQDQAGSPLLNEKDVQPAAPYAFSQSPENMPVPRNEAPRNIVRERMDELSYADTEAFVKRFEEDEQAREDADFLIEQGRAPSVRWTPRQAALDAGETVDLLQLPQDASGMAQGIRMFGLPEGTGALTMGSNDTGLGTIATPTGYYEPQPIATPYQQKEALPQAAGPSAGQGQWAGGRSQLSYPWPGMAQGIGGLMNMQQPEQATPPSAMPTQSQITNTQVAPRADTTAMTAGLGMPAPEAMPQEAQPARTLNIPPAPAANERTAPPRNFLQDHVLVGTVPPPAAEKGSDIPARRVTPQVEPSWNYGLPSFVTAPHAQAPASQADEITPDNTKKPEKRSELIKRLPEESRAEARRMTNDELRRRVDTEGNPVPFSKETIGYTEEDDPMPTAPGGTIFITASGRKTKPFPRTDYSTPGKHKASNARVAQWLIDEAAIESKGNGFVTSVFRRATPDNLTMSDRELAVITLSEGFEPDIPFVRPLEEAISKNASVENAENERANMEENAPLLPNPAEKKSSEPESGMVKSEKTAEEDRHARDDGKQSAKQPVVEKQAAVASGEQSEASSGNVEQPEPREAAAPSRLHGGKRREADVSDDGHTGRHSAGTDSGGILSDDGLPGRGTLGRTSDRNSGVGGEGARGGSRDGRRGRGDGGQVGDDSQPSTRGPANQNNHRIAEDDTIVPGGAVARAKANIAAIRLVKKLEKEGRAATPEEKKILTQFTGWGSLAQTVFNPDHTRTALSEADAKKYGWSSPVEHLPVGEREKYEKWKRQYGAVLMPGLGGLLTEKEWAAAEKSTLNAHYTDRNVVSAMWKMAQRLGFHGGRILEPSAGTGLFFGLMPEEISRKSSLVGVELDEVTGKILKYLYPDADIQITGFEKSKRLGDNTVDLVISNVPFGNIPVFDKARPQYSKQSIHNYFFSRALDAVRPGGLVMQITSHFTLDGGSTARLREEWSKKADLVAAVRLPGTAFEKNAGTEVTTDIIVFRKKTDSGAQFGQPFRNLATVETKDGETQINEYFVTHPEMVLGEHSLSGSMYGGNEYTLLPKKDESLQDGLNRAVAAVPADVYGIETAMPAPIENHAGMAAQEGAKEGALVEDGEGVYVVVDGRLEKPEWADKAKRVEQAKAYIGVKDSALRLISVMNTDDGDARVKEHQRELNEKYDAYVKEFGPINKPGNKFLEDDIEFPTMAALERVTEVVVQKAIKSGANKGNVRQDKEKRVSKADIFSKRTIFPFHAPDHADSTEDAIKISRIYKNKIDLSYIADLLGVDIDQAKKRLLGTMEVFENPESGLLEPRDVYLSGNVREKLQRAEAAAEENPAYTENVTALREVQPSRIGIDSIYAKIGSSWLPPHIYEGFLNHIGVKSASVHKTRLPGAEGGTTWNVEGYNLSADAKNKWGTESASVMRIIEDCLNLKRTVITDTFRDGGTSKTVRNEAETLAAQEKQRLLQDEFSRWLKGSEYATEIEDIYNRTFNGSVVRHFDVPDIKYYPGASHSIELRDNQKKGVARALQESCLLAHGVGSGKTMLQITLAMEMRRLGTAKKPWIVVQGATLSQFAATFKELYPGARILAPTEDQRTAKNRRRLLAQIASGDWDAVITPHGFFNGVSVSPETEERFIEEQIFEYEELLTGTDKNERRTRKEIEKKIDRLKTRLEKLADTRKDENIYFDALGIDALIIDEAHAYKRGQFVTKMDNVKGLDRDSSQRSMQLLMKARMVQAKTGGKNVILATGTPISNTLTEMWTMFRYTRPDLLKQFGVEQFDDFATAFAATSVTQEETATGEWKDVERFNKYVNGPELLTLWGLGADVAITEDLSSIKNMPKLKGGKIHEVSVDRSEALSNYIESLRQERIAWDKLTGKEKREKSHVPLTIYGRAKQAAIDLRLVDPSLEDEHESKANIAVRNIFERWEKYKDDKAAQIVFSDTFQSRDKSFNLFEDIKKKLIQLGVPSHEIAIIHDYKTDEARKRLFDSVKTGDVRVLMGTTEKLGVGVNVQDRLVTAHHLDAPQRPMDFEQRNGRIRRPGNIYQDVEILTYGTKNTLDSVTFQQLISKQKFINQLLRGNVFDRSFENPFDATQATFEDMMAAFSGNPLAKEKMQLMAEVRRLAAQLAAHNSQISNQRYKLRSMRSRLEQQRELLSKEQAVADFVKKYFPDGAIEDRKEISKRVNEWLTTESKKILDAIEKITTEGQWYTKDKSSLTKDTTIDIGHGLSVDISLVPRIIFPTEANDEIERYVASSFTLHGPHEIKESDTFNGAQGLLTRLSNKLTRLQDSEGIARAGIKDTEAQIASLEKEVERPFPQQKELDTAEKRLAEIEKELEEATKIEKEDDKGKGGEPFASINPGQYLAPPRKARALLRRSAVQSVIDSLGRIAKNAAESRVVQTFDELPENIRRRYASEETALEGVFDPATRQVWFVADNISDAGRAAEVWAHEQIVHNGLRGMLSDTERRGILNRLWLGMGGMGNARIRQVARTYGLNPRANEADRLTIMEEVVAAMAEKRRLNDLTQQELSLWKRIVRAVARAWRRIILAVTGGNNSARTMPDVDGLLAALGRYVMDGIPPTYRGAGAADTALASMNPEYEGSAPLASLSLAGIMRVGTKRASTLADAPEIQHLFRKSDLTFLQGIVQLPHWIAKQAKEFAGIYDRQLQRMDERSAALKKSLETVPSLFGKSRLSGADLESLKTLLWEIEGRETWQEHVSGVDKFVTKEVLASGRELIEVNPAFYEAFKRALDAADATPRAKEAMLEIRKSLDNDLVLAHNRMASMSEMSDDAIRDFRQSIGHVPNYFPHHRYGAYFVQAKVGSEVVFRQHFDAVGEKAAMAKARKIVMAQRANYPGAKWTDGKNDRLPDEILGAPIDSEAMEQIIRSATSKIGDKERAREISDLLTEGVADVLKSRGWGSHGIRRKGTPGFETDDIARVLYDYKAGLNGWLTKMEAARDFSDALSRIDARKKPNLWKYAAQYTKDMLRNSDRVDRITGNIKAVAFAWYLGGSIKTAVVNATQNLVVGVPRLQMDVSGGALMWLKGAQDAIVDRVTGNKGRGLAEDEARLVAELYGESVITDAFMEEVRGQLSGVTGASLWNKFTKILGLPMSEVERFNRASLALAAYRAARRGNLKEKAKKKYGIEGKATYEQAKDFASEVVRDAHFVYGKSNMPEFMRSNTAGRAMASMYTFRTFSHNMLAMWAWALKTQGREGAAFCAKSIGATMALGGVTALPMYATLMALFQAITGDDDDWTEMIRGYLPQNNLLRDAVCYGAPAMAGVNIGGSLKMETPLTKGLAKGKNPKEVLTDSIGDIIGIPYDLGIVRISNVMDAQASGNYWRMIEEAMPTFVKNGMQAWRLYSEGQTTMRGRPINSPGKPGARKLSGAEAVGKALGFQPVSSTKSYDAYAASKRRDGVRSEKLNELTVLVLKTHDTGDPSGRRQAIKEIGAWNARMKEEGKPQMTITLKDVMRRVKARRRQNRMSGKEREKGALQAETWGI